MSDPLLDNLYEYLRPQITDLETAKKWMQSFYDNGQYVGRAMYSMRAMSGHVSRILEGTPPSRESSFETKYGPELYESVTQHP